MKIIEIIKLYGIKTLGILLIIGGIIGLFLPILQGVLMIVTGWALFRGKSIKQQLKKIKAFVQRRYQRSGK